MASKFECISWRRASRYDTSRILENNLRRQLDRILYQGKCGLGDEKHLEVRNLIYLKFWISNKNFLLFATTRMSKRDVIFRIAESYF